MPCFGTGIHGLSLSSLPVSEGDQIRACPHTSVVLTCTTSQTQYLTWFYQNNETLSFFPPDINNEELTVIHNSLYTFTLVAVDNPVDFVADITSTLEVMVDDIDNGTNITCQTSGDEEHKLIYKASKYVVLHAYPW